MKKFESLGRSLSKGEQKNIMGGLAAPPKGKCNVHGSGGSNGGVTVSVINVSGTCAEQSAAANNWCVNQITSGNLASCGYDCLCDGAGV